MTLPASNIVPLPAPKAESKWLNTKYANIIRYIPSGVYFIRARVNSRHVRQTLKTKSIEIAHTKTLQIIQQEKKRAPKQGDYDKATMGQLAAEYEQETNADDKLKPRSVEYRLESLRQLRETWPTLYETEPHKIRKSDIAQWAKEAKAKYSATRFNGTLETLRRLVKMAIERGLLLEDPTAKTKRASVPVKDRQLPDTDQLKQLMARLDALPRRKAAARFVRTMLFTMLRRGAVAKLMPANIDLKRNEIIRPSIKYDSGARIPMIPEMRALAEQLLADYPGTGPLIPIKNPRRALKTCCKDIGIPRLTSQSFRHISTTHLLELGIDVPTVAKLRGDRDKGAMLLKNYSHTRDKHSHEQANKIKFF